MNSSKNLTTFDAGDYIFREGDLGENAYIIESGIVELSLDRDHQNIVIATLSEGDIFGETAIVEHSPRSTSARALSATKVTEIPIDYVRQKIEHSDPTVRMFLRSTMARYRELSARLGHMIESLLPFPGKFENTKDYTSTTMELKSIVSQFTDMQKRIDQAVTSPVKAVGDSPVSERTLEITRVLVTEEKLLRQAIAQQQFRLHYQPIVDLMQNKIVGCEALVRWHHPSGDLVLPSGFMTQIESTDLIIKLGYWIAEEACRFQSRVYNQLRLDFFVSINLSGKQFNDAGLISRLDEIMNTTRASRPRIKFEVTESLLIDNPELATQSLKQLKDTGARLAIDDFGTGYSSFSYLHRFPFDALKIDRSFVSTMARSHKSEQIVKSLINLAHDLEMEVVAEGIESSKEADMLRTWNAEYGQGFFFSRPVDEASFLALLKPRIKRGEVG